MSQQERVVELLEFPGYSVSDRGYVINNKTGRVLRSTKKKDGYLMVGMMKTGIQQKRSLSLLVAHTFLARPHLDAFDTPIHLDGDKANCRYDNLMWRPLWFARKYMNQFDDGHATYDGPIEDVETHERYSCSMEAAMANGVLDNEIYKSMLNNHYVWPTGQVFRKVVEF